MGYKKSRNYMKKHRKTLQEFEKEWIPCPFCAVLFFGSLSFSGVFQHSCEYCSTRIVSTRVEFVFLKFIFEFENLTCFVFLKNSF